MTKIKIVYILGVLEMGGTERQFLETMRRLDRTRFDLRVLAFQESGAVRTAIEALGIPFTGLNFFGLHGKFCLASYLQLYQLIRNMVRYLKQERPQIVQSFLFWANVYGSIAAKIAGVPVILTGRRSTMEEQHKRVLGRWLQNLSDLCATAIVTNSQTAKNVCLRRDRFTTEVKMQVIYNGIESDQYLTKADTTCQRADLQIPDGVMVVGMIANLHPCKGHRDVLKAAVQILQAQPATVFLLVGRDAGLQAELEGFASRSGIRETVMFTGDRSDIPDLLALLDIQVLASYVEGLPNAILEGMAAGKPVVATDVGGIAELVVHEETGLLVPPGDSNALADAIIRLLRDHTLREKMGKAGRKRVQALFGMERMIQQTEMLYQKLVNS